MTIPLLSGPQDPSQLDNLLNQLIIQINGYVSGTTPQTVQISTATTSAAIAASGTVILGSTVSNALYAMAAPVKGQTVRLITNSTKGARIGGLFNKTKTLITLLTTAGAKLAQPAVVLTGLSSSAWGISAVAGNVKST